MAVINIDDAYILNETGAQVDKVTGLFTKDEDTTEEEKAFAQLNIGASGDGGRNLLDNPWFTVNQRAFTTAADGAPTYTVDRWKKATYGTASFSNGIMTLQATQQIYFLQYIPGDLRTWLTGKTVTISVWAENVVGTWYWGGFNMGSRAKNLSNGITTFTFVMPSGSSQEFNIFSDVSGSSIDIIACKLELGSVSTLANDAPPEYAEELMKCNFYDIMLKTSAQYGYLGYGIADSATSATILIPLPNNMRDATPTITTGGTIAVKGGTSGTHTITGITIKLRVTGGVLVTVTTSGLTAGEFCLLQLNNTSSYINLSADL